MPQKKYTEDFKQQIVELYNLGNKSFGQLESEYGVPKSTMVVWIKKLSPVKIGEEETITMKEFKTLQKKMRELELENEILKKATAIFAKNL